jgi:hypothetical protein
MAILTVGPVSGIEEQPPFDYGSYIFPAGIILMVSSPRALRILDISPSAALTLPKRVENLFDHTIFSSSIQLKSTSASLTIYSIYYKGAVLNNPSMQRCRFEQSLEQLNQV